MPLIKLPVQKPRALAKLPSFPLPFLPHLCTWSPRSSPARPSALHSPLRVPHPRVPQLCVPPFPCPPSPVSPSPVSREPRAPPSGAGPAADPPGMPTPGSSSRHRRGLLGTCWLCRCGSHILPVFCFLCMPGEGKHTDSRRRWGFQALFCSGNGKV